MVVVGVDGLMKIGARPDKTLPEGYSVRVHCVCYYASMMHDGTIKNLLNSNKEPKRFRLQDKAYEYARQHSQLKLRYDQEVPDWQ